MCFGPHGLERRERDGALDTISDNGVGGDPIAEYDYIGGRTLRRKMRNGVNLDLRDGSATRYDNAGLPTRWAHLDTKEQGSPVVIGFEYGYDPGGNKLYQRSLHDPLDSQRYAYDSAERLAAYSRSWFGEGDYAPSSPEYCDAATSAPWSGMTQAQKWLLEGRTPVR